MREAIRNALIAGIPEVEGRIFEPHSASADTQKPYLIVKENAEQDNTEWAGFRGHIEVWPYVEESSYTEVDALAKKVAATLNMQLITDETGDAITCVSDGMLEDVADTEWQALTRCVNFYVLALQPSEVQGPLANDPWIDALVSWTQAILGNGYDVRGGQLPVGYKRPAVLWRLDNIQIEDCGSLAFDVVKGVACHVFGRNAVEEANVAVQLIEEMGNAVKLPISAAERRYMTIRDIKGNVYTDALKQGHIRATVARRTRRPREEVAIIGSVSTDGHIEQNQEEGV